MRLAPVDLLVVGLYFAASLAIGLWVARRAGRSPEEFFASGRSMPWWLLGASMVATTFSTDTPNLVTDITRKHGVAGNWVWWAFLLTGMLTVFVYARLWRRSGVLTDLELYELRYSGRPAAFLRAFRALYLGVFFNVVVMASVTLAAIKIGGVMLGLSPLATIAGAALVTVLVSAAGGLRGVVLTDTLLFALAMLGAVVAAVVALGHPEVGGLGGLLAHPEVARRLALTPDFTDPATFVPLFVIPLAVQWWAAWYPGAEPGGGGYVAQRMLAAKDEGHATGATLFFNVAHYALRPWPWILVALASVVVFPDLASLARAFPGVDPAVINDDLAYPAMLTFLPPGLLGLVVGSLAAAYVSTISTHLNWGSSYVVHDVYRRFVDPGAGRRRLVRLGRVTTVVLMLLAAAMALTLRNALEAFQLLLQIGAGTGLLFILRWFWWRINAWSELAAMLSSFAVAVGFFIDHKLRAAEAARLAAAGLSEAAAVTRDGGLAGWQELLVGVAVTTACWLAVTGLTRPADPETLRAFYRRVRPGGPGWRPVVAAARADGEELEPAGEAGWEVPRALLLMLLGSLLVYAALFATGLWLYGRPGPALGLTLAGAACLVALLLTWRFRYEPPS